jgi:hypothetical protein
MQDQCLWKQWVAEAMVFEATVTKDAVAAAEPMQDHLIYMCWVVPPQSIIKWAVLPHQVG